MRLLRHPALMVVLAVPALASLVPALIWLGFDGHGSKVVIGAAMASLFATGRMAMRVLDRLGVSGEWARLGWVSAAALVGIALWGVILCVGAPTSKRAN